MTDNDRLFGPYRRAQLEPLFWADVLRRAINAQPRLELVAVAHGDEVAVHVHAHTQAFPYSPRDLRGYRQ